MIKILNLKLVILLEYQHKIFFAKGHSTNQFEETVVGKKSLELKKQ